MNQELSMSPNLLVAALQNRLPNYESRHCFLYKGERHSYGELHVSCGRRETEDTELCHQ
mgnify:CR=1 FL=1